MENIMNSPIVYIMGIAAFAVLVMLTVLVMLPRLIKRGVDVSGIIEKTNVTVAALDTVVDLVKQLFPGAPMGIVERIMDYAKKAVSAAEQMYKASQISAKERKLEATELVYKFLESAGVEVTEDVKRIVDGAIEAAVYALPKTHEPQENKTEAEA